MLAESAGFLTSSLLFDNPQSHVSERHTVLGLGSRVFGMRLRLLSFSLIPDRQRCICLLSGHGAARGMAKELRKKTG